MQIDPDRLVSHNAVAHTDEEQKLENLQRLARNRRASIKKSEKTERLHHVRNDESRTEEN